MAVDTDEQALDAVKRFLSYLPSHHNEAAAGAPGAGRLGRRLPRHARASCPSRATRSTTCAKSSRPIADRDSTFEIKERYGKSLTTVLARLDGHSVGFIANNPLFKGGALDADACQKVTSFMVLCDSFNIPLVYLVDVPGFLIGVEGEMRGMPGKVINWMNAMTPVTVPKITIIMRKSYGQAYINMAGGKNADEVALWPTADLGFMDPAVSVNILYGVKQEDDPERFKQAVAEVQRDTSAWGLAELYDAQNVIDPRDTRELPDPRARSAPPAPEQRRRPAPAGQLADQLLERADYSPTSSPVSRQSPSLFDEAGAVLERAARPAPAAGSRCRPAS